MIVNDLPYLLMTIQYNTSITGQAQAALPPFPDGLPSTARPPRPGCGAALAPRQHRRPPRTWGDPKVP